eukprot:gene706-385_t
MKGSQKAHRHICRADWRAQGIFHFKRMGIMHFLTNILAKKIHAL